MNKHLLSFYGLKWHPFLPDVPTEALLCTPAIDSFIRRVEQQVREGGFALVTGEPGCGKSVALRLLAQRLSSLRDVVVAELEHRRSKLLDFYREMGELFGLQLPTLQRYRSFKMLREKWIAHIKTTLMRPVLLIDEAQEAPADVLTELRMLSSTHFDSRCILTVVLCGDGRLVESFRSQELLPLATRMRIRLNLQPATPEELANCLRHSLEQAGNSVLMTKELIQTLCEHAVGNYRVLFNMATDLLMAGFEREAKQLDEKLYFDTFAQPSAQRKKSR